MLREELVFVGICDIAGHVRGKSFPAREIECAAPQGHRLDPLQPDADRIRADLGHPVRHRRRPDDRARAPRPRCGSISRRQRCRTFLPGDIRNTDGSPWECCPREFLRRGIAALSEAGGLHLIAAFEQEFVYTGNEERPGDAYSLGAFRRQGAFGESFVAALRAAGVAPDSFLAEYGARQFEVTVAPPCAAAADQAVITREMARAAAHRLGHRAVFSPMPAADGVGNGVHIHMSLREATGRPVTYDPPGPFGLGLQAQQFCAGVLHHLPAMRRSPRRRRCLICG